MLRAGGLGMEVGYLLALCLVLLGDLFLFSSIACTPHDKDLGVVNEPVGDRRGHGS